MNSRWVPPRPAQPGAKPPVCVHRLLAACTAPHCSLPPSLLVFTPPIQRRYQSKPSLPIRTPFHVLRSAVAPQTASGLSTFLSGASNTSLAPSSQFFSVGRRALTACAPAPRTPPCLPALPDFRPWRAAASLLAGNWRTAQFCPITFWRWLAEAEALHCTSLLWVAVDNPLRVFFPPFRWRSQPAPGRR